MEKLIFLWEWLQVSKLQFNAENIIQPSKNFLKCSRYWCEAKKEKTSKQNNPSKVLKLMLPLSNYTQEQNWDGLYTPRTSSSIITSLFIVQKWCRKNYTIYAEN